MIDRIKHWTGSLAIVLSGQLALLVSVGALEEGQPEWWMTVMFALMIPLGLLAFIVGVGLVFGWVRLCAERRRG